MRPSILCREVSLKFPCIFLKAFAIFELIETVVRRKKFYFSHRWDNISLFRTTNAIIMISRTSQISAENTRKNACRAPSIKAFRNLFYFSRSGTPKYEVILLLKQILYMEFQIASNRFQNLNEIQERKKMLFRIT